MIASPQFDYLSPTDYLHLEEHSDLYPDAIVTYDERDKSNSNYKQ
ncbi:hypothetical protein [Chamaesiphon sp.]